MSIFMENPSPWPHNNDLMTSRQKPLKNITWKWENAVTSNFSFFLNVFYPVIYRIRIKCGSISKISNEIWRIDNFRALARKTSFFPNRVRYFSYTATPYKYSIYLSTFNLLSFIISNTETYMNLAVYGNGLAVDCVINRGFYPQKMDSCSKNIRGTSVFVLKISLVYKKKKKIFWVILHRYLRSWKIKINIMLINYNDD